MKTREILTIAFVVVCGAFVLYGAGILPIPSLKRINKVVIEVDYDGEWQGAIAEVGAIISWSGKGKTTRVMERPKSGSWIISFNAQKLDDSKKTLTIRIKTMEGKILKESSTNTQYGMAQLSVEIK